MLYFYFEMLNLYVNIVITTFYFYFKQYSLLIILVYVYLTFQMFLLIYMEYGWNHIGKCLYLLEQTDFLTLEITQLIELRVSMPSYNYTWLQHNQIYKHLCLIFINSFKHNSFRSRKVLNRAGLSSNIDITYHTSNNCVVLFQYIHMN